MAEKNKKRRKVVLIAGSRSEFGYYQPIIEEIKRRSNMDYGIIVTNTHLLNSFGRTVDHIKDGKFKIEATIYNTFDGYNRVTMAKSLSVFMLQLPELLEKIEADIILVAGDRGEQMMAAIVGAHLYIPVAHIQAGELSGNIDGTIRHAITKLAHLHFVSNQDAADRVLRMGEEKGRIFLVGAPQLDDLVSGHVTSKEKIYEKYSLDNDKPNLLFVFHSVTEEYDRIAGYMDEVMGAIVELGLRTVVITSNSDAGSNIVRQKIKEYRQPFMYTVESVQRPDYAGLMNTVDAIVGNSSSGILEAPTFKLPAINIGSRQTGRIQSINVINVDYEKEAIKMAIKKAISPAFKLKLKQCVNLYGDGQSSKRIVDVLERIKIDDSLLVKKMTY